MRAIQVLHAQTLPAFPRGEWNFLQDRDVPASETIFQHAIMSLLSIIVALIVVGVLL